MNPAELKKILSDHREWLEGGGGRRANLSGVDLVDANLRGANLRDAKLIGARLLDADLRRANLRGANLNHADMRHADMIGADLRHADLRYADMISADLTDADMIGADLRHADLRHADLRDADLSGAMMPVTQPCPDSGAFIGWKKVKGHILKLQIPASADRVAAWGRRKCRASKAKLVAAWDRDGNRVKKGTRIGPARDGYYWTVGETHEPDRFCDDRRRECSSGLHFFVTRQEAEEWK